ncbi:hypothetical protein [Saccharospirillum mangrovi]|uniref:hypothetical protein n=1 Tax=Saccharospirillum mangrovi TaxID=2161747 RepID=UPI000D36D65C|nr:hypothetical protein [Saccharospirillum mangrovi]
MWKSIAPLLAAGALTGCSAIAIQDTNVEKLNVAVEYHHQPGQVEVRTELRAGQWNRRVDADSQRPEIITAGGEVVPMLSGVEAGDYGVRLDPETGPYLLVLPEIAELELPLTGPVALNGQAQVSGQVFNRDDELTLAISGQTDRVRGWSFTAYCGDERWTLNLSLDQDDSDISLPLATLMRQINAKAEADLAGQIPVTVTLWENYDVNWAPPFRPGIARAEDEVHFTVDTAGLRVSGSISLQLATSLRVGVNNQAWPVRFCH